MNVEYEPRCADLDAYLDGDLSARGRDAFSSHLVECPTCREAVDQQRWIDKLLTSEEAVELEAAPALTAPRRPRRRWRVGMAAAVAALAAWPLISFSRRERPGEERPTHSAVQLPDPVATVENPSPSPSLPGARSSAAATFASAGGAVAVPVDSSDAQVTVVRLYPTLAATRRMARERALAAPPSNGG